MAPIDYRAHVSAISVRQPDAVNLDALKWTSFPYGT